jgi:predicted extracellular nuclease
VDITADDGTVSVVIAHLKSKLLTFVDEFGNSSFQPRDEDQRARYGAYALNRRSAEAASLRSHLNGVLAGKGRERFVLLMGDLNDEVDAATTQILNGPGGSEIGTAGFEHADKGDGDRLWNLGPLIPEEQRFSRIYRGRPELIDHIFTSHRMLKTAPEVSTAIAESQATTLRSIEDDPRPEQGKPGSDHSAVIAEFELG